MVHTLLRTPNVFILTFVETGTICIRFGTSNTQGILIRIAEPIRITGKWSRSGGAGSWGWVCKGDTLLWQGVTFQNSKASS